MLSLSDNVLSGLLQAALKTAKHEHIPPQNIKILLSEITGLTLPELIVKGDFRLSEEQVSRFESGIERLKKHEPVQYITGRAHFYGLALAVNKSVLIPRPETEGLVDWLCQRETGPKRILDIGTGSGAIALALKTQKPGYSITATDISPEALALAKSNAEALGLDISFKVADLFPPEKSCFDVIVSNPPYISENDYATLDEEIRLFEPKLALYADRNGLDFYYQILNRAQQYLCNNGRIYLEIGDRQASQIREIALEAGFSKVEINRDLTGRDRYLCALL